MRARELALAQGISETRATLAEWRSDGWRIVSTWVGWSTLVAATLLASVYAVATSLVPDATPFEIPGVDTPATLGHLAHVLYRNSLVLALHAMACVAGFIAGSALPRSAQAHTGTWRVIHDRAGPFAIAFVLCATVFSLVTQAYVLGGWASALAAYLELSPGVLLLAVLPHALPELIALFLPLAAWMVASRLGEWHTLLAATLATVVIAVPMLVLSGAVEVYITPRLLASLAG